MKQISTGILAHVDAGKTTLSEGLLYCAGEIRKLGRVDSQNTFLDTDEMERRRGITIFSKQAILTVEDTRITLLDTPGHVDFSAEAERTLQVIDYAVLVISGTDGVQSHTTTLWNLLLKHRIPTFVFVNKLDLAGADYAGVLDTLRDSFDANFIDFTDADTQRLQENLAMCDEALMQMYLEKECVTLAGVAEAIRRRNVYPCFGGAALKMEGVERFLKAFAALTYQPTPLSKFGARVFKIGTDERGQRLTYLKVTGGTLKVKTSVASGVDFDEKINEIRLYSGDRYQSAEEATSGCVCAVTGPKHTYAGQGLGFEENADKLTAEPIFNYRVLLPQGTDAAAALAQLRQLEQEETQLGIVWNEHLKEIQLRLMGEIQLEVLKQMIYKRFGMEVEFEQGRIVYKETIENTVEGVGHYEPLRHYAEVHLVLEPLARGAGLHFAADVSEDVLDKNWQRLVLTHLMEKTHFGVLTGSPITDMKITLRAGRAHLKHTEGGDFRQATYRAVRHGLRSAKSVLLEPYYDFCLEIPVDNVGRAMTDLDRMGASFAMPQTRGNVTKIEGSVAADAIRNYHRELVGYTHGMGKLSCKFKGYDVCKNAEAVIEQIGYNSDADLDNTADSVFCSHGAGYTVKWDEVTEHMHLDSVLKPKKAEAEEVQTVRSGGVFASDGELLRIFERTYGKVERKIPQQAVRYTAKETEYKPSKAKKLPEQSYLLIDGYNIIFAWDDLQKISKDSLEAARNALIERISAYKVFKAYEEIIIVFDAYKVKGNRGEIERINGVTVVYTKESQTADAYIEKAVKELSRNYKVTVATSDGLEQIIIFGSGAFRMPARILLEDVERVEASVTEMVERYNLNVENSDYLRVLEKKLKELEVEE